MFAVRRMAPLAILAALAGGWPRPAGADDLPAPSPSRLRAVAVLAHPDDELIMAPALASLARQGHEVEIVHATAGDAGPGVSGLAKGEGLAAARRAEADCAGRALGTKVRHLGFGDGLLAEHMRDGSLAAALAPHVTGAEMVLTWGPDGGYGHADHRLVSAVASQIAQSQPESERARVLYVGIPAGARPPVAAMADWAVSDPALLTETIAYSPADLAAATAAAQCHITQFDAASRAGMMALFDATMWRGAVRFRRAF